MYPWKINNRVTTEPRNCNLLLRVKYVKLRGSCQEKVDSVNDGTDIEAEVRCREEANTVNSSSSPVRLSNSENSINALKVHLYGKTKSFIEHEQMTGDAYRPDTPLLLATIHGCTEIVEEILKVYPQAVEHIDHDGRNILSLAILHRRIEIIDLVDRMRIQKQRVRRNIDNYGNTLLHLVGERVDEQNEELKGPALVLQEDTLLFKVS
ncbi:ankyrin repeat-containing protein [Tanacetum coccineum]